MKVLLGIAVVSSVYNKFGVSLCYQTRRIVFNVVIAFMTSGGVDAVFASFDKSRADHVS